MACFTTILILVYLCIVQLSLGFNLTIIHTNDVHDRYEQFEPRNGGHCSEKKAAKGQCFGGVSRRMTKIREIREREKNVLLMDAGDQYVGTTWFTTYGGEAAAYYMNNLTYDVMALGNHEFDWGIKGLLPLLKGANFRVVCSNLDSTHEPRIHRLYERSTVLTVAGESIAVIGYVLPQTKYISNPGTTVAFTDEIEAIRVEVKKLQKRGINKIVALGHSGFTRDQEIAREVDGIDIIVGGHSNTFLYNGKPPSYEVPIFGYPHVVTQKSGKKVLIVQDYTFGKYLGHLKVTFDDKGTVTSWSGNPIILDNTVKQDAKMEEDVNRWAIPVRNLSQQVVGSSRVYLEGARGVCRRYECNLGNLIADALVYKYMGQSNSTHWAQVGLAIVNSGGIRSSISQGVVTRGDANNVQPFRNTNTLIEITGRHLLEVFEHSVSNFQYNDLNGKFLQVSGFRVVYDLSKPNNERVVSLQVRCTSCPVPKLEPVKTDQVYKIIAYSFLANGGDGYTVLRDKRTLLLDYGDMDIDTTIAYISKFSPVLASVEGRILHHDGQTIRDVCGVNSSQSPPLTRTRRATTPDSASKAAPVGVNVGVIFALVLCFLFNVYRA